MPKLRIRRKPDRRSLHTKTMFYTTKGLILRETQYKDNDKLLDVLTGDMGLGLGLLGLPVFTMGGGLS